MSLTKKLLISLWIIGCLCFWGVIRLLIRYGLPGFIIGIAILLGAIFILKYVIPLHVPIGGN